MLKVELTENLGGFKISGDYDDLNNLYKSICNFFDKECKSAKEEIMQNHIFGFLYDVRHAYQGDREYLLVDNLSDDKREWFGLKKRDVSNNNLYYSFNYLLTDIIVDMVLIKYFIDYKDTEYNANYHMVNYFYSLILNTLESSLTKTKFNKIKKGIINSYINDKIFIPQWFDNISIDYIKMDKEKREKNLTKLLNMIYNYNDYQEYFRIKKEVEELSEKEKCPLDSIYYMEYPEEII